MKRFFRVMLWSLLIASVACAHAASKKGAAIEKKLSTKVECEDFNSVGNEWMEALFVNGISVAVYSNEQLLESIGTFPLVTGDEIIASAFILEADKKSPDYSEGRIAHAVTAKDIKDGFDLAFDVIVEENDGQYKGNQATWHVVFSFE